MTILTRSQKLFKTAKYKRYYKNLYKNDSTVIWFFSYVKKQMRELKLLESEWDNNDIYNDVLLKKTMIYFIENCVL